MKFGGTSVATVERIRNVARHVKREVLAGYDVAVVVSAMAGKTNELVSWVKEASALYDSKEYDVGRRLRRAGDLGAPRHRPPGDGASGPLLAGLADPDPTSEAHGSARIAEIDGAGIASGFARREVAVVSGFQGIHQATRPAHNPRPGRLRHERGGPRSRHRGGALRHLHGRRRRLHHRSRASSRRPAGSTGSPTRRCWKWPPSAPRCCRSARWSSPWCIGSRPTCAPPSTIRTIRSSAPSSATRTTSWNSRSSPASPIPRTRPRSRCGTSPTSRASPPRSSGPSPTPTSTST